MSRKSSSFGGREGPGKTEAGGGSRARAPSPHTQPDPEQQRQGDIGDPEGPRPAPQRGTRLSLGVSLNSFHCKQQMPTGPGLSLQDDWLSQPAKNAPKDQTSCIPDSGNPQGSVGLCLPLFSVFLQVAPTWIAFPLGNVAKVTSSSSKLHSLA